MERRRAAGQGAVWCGRFLCLCRAVSRMIQFATQWWPPCLCVCGSYKNTIRIACRWLSFERLNFVYIDKKKVFNQYDREMFVDGKVLNKICISHVLQLFISLLAIESSFNQISKWLSPFSIWKTNTYFLSISTIRLFTSISRKVSCSRNGLIRESSRVVLRHKFLQFFFSNWLGHCTLGIWYKMQEVLAVDRTIPAHQKQITILIVFYST